MEQRTFGSSGTKVSALGIGSGRIGLLARGAVRRNAINFLKAALDAGITFYDTADSYGLGQNEILIGEAFASLRDQVFIATKVGYPVTFRGKLSNKAKALAGKIFRNPGISVSDQCFDPAYICSALDASLTRLGTDYVDLFMLHSPPLDILKNDDLIATLEQARQAGKVRLLGVSCQKPEHAIACFDQGWVEAVQITINFAQQGAIDTVLPYATERGIAVVARQPFGGGALAHRPTDEYGLSADQVALQFMMRVRGVAVVLAGMTDRNHLDRNIETLGLPQMTDAMFKAFRRKDSPDKATR